MSKPTPKPPPNCHVCGDSCNVPRSYVEPGVGAKAGKEKVKCPKCCVERNKK